MKTFRLLAMLFMVTLSVFGFGVMNVLACTATATATANGGENCGSISKKGRDNTGAMTVVEVKINGKLTTAYTVVAGTNGSTRPRISFNPALAKGDVVEVTLDTKLDGNHTVNLKLEAKRSC